MDLWEAGQDRVERENRERAVERFVTGRDAYVAVHSKTPYTPSYAAPLPGSADVKKAHRDTLAHLARIAPGRVTVH